MRTALKSQRGETHSDKDPDIADLININVNEAGLGSIPPLHFSSMEILMTKHRILVLAAAFQLLSMSGVALAASDEQNGHHYQGGPKTETIHHMQQQPPVSDKETVGSTTKAGHHYNGGPKTETIHHMGEKK
jgi:hypothetical protein